MAQHVQRQGGAGTPAPEAAGGRPSGDGDRKGKDDVIDAEFEVKN